MSIRDWALNDPYISRGRAKASEEAPTATYAHGQPITQPPPPDPPPRPAPDAIAWSPAVPHAAPTVHQGIHSATRGTHPSTNAPWKPAPETCVLVRPGPMVYEQMMAGVPDLLPAYEQYHGVKYSGPDAMEMGGNPLDSNCDAQRGRRYGSGDGSARNYIQRTYGGMADANASTSFSISNGR